MAVYVCTQIQEIYATRGTQDLSTEGAGRDKAGHLVSVRALLCYLNLYKTQAKCKSIDVVDFVPFTK